MIRRLIILLLIVGCVFAQQYEDVVILKNGSEIHGIIIEEKPNEYIKIKSGKNIFVYEFDEIELLKKELVENESKNSSNKTRSVAVGFGTNRSLTLLGLSRDFRLGNHFSFFLTAGIGTALSGMGIAYQNNYNENGVNFSTTFGIYTDGDNPLGSLNLSLNYQWKIGKQSFISAGIMGGSYEYNNLTYYCYDGYCEDIIHSQEYVFPTISYDYRF